MMMMKKGKNPNTFVNVRYERKLTYAEQNYHKDVIAQIHDLFNHFEMSERKR